MAVHIVINNPNLDERIDTLKYIGPHISKQFRKEGLVTLRSLKDYTESNSRSQNIRFLRKVLENPRKLECVGHLRYDQSSKEYKKYCVRRVNKLAWYAIIVYLKRKGVNSNLLPNEQQQIGPKEKCKGCEGNPPADLLPIRYVSIPYYPLESIVYYMLQNEDKTEYTAMEVWNMIKRKWPRKSIGAILSKNSDDYGRKLFTITGKTEKYNKPIYKLKNGIRRSLRNKSDEFVLKYIREL